MKGGKTFGPFAAPEKVHGFSLRCRLKRGPEDWTGVIEKGNAHHVFPFPTDSFVASDIKAGARQSASLTCARHRLSGLTTHKSGRLSYRRLVQVKHSTTLGDENGRDLGALQRCML